jgi:hypothetical protein
MASLMSPPTRKIPASEPLAVSKLSNKMDIFQESMEYHDMEIVDEFPSVTYPLVNIQKTMEHHHFSWENQRTKWPFSIAMLNYQRVV